MELEDMATVPELSAEYNVKPRTVQQAIKRGQLTASRIGRQYLIKRATFKHWYENVYTGPRPKKQN